MPFCTCPHQTQTGEYRKDTRQEDRGFLGYTHALTILAAIPILTGAIHIAASSLNSLFPAFVLTPQGFVLTAAALAGASILNDLDGEESSAKSALWLLGDVLSSTLRAVAIVVQTVVRTPYDAEIPDPHRGLWHSLLGIVGLLALPTHWVLTVGNDPSRMGVQDWAAFGLIWALAYLGLYVLVPLGMRINPAAPRRKNGSRIHRPVPPVVKLGVFLLAGGLVAWFWLTSPGVSLAWAVGPMIAVGMIAHSIGDMFTPGGAPLFAGFTYFTKRKMWWATRVAKIETGSDREHQQVTYPLAVAALVGWGLLAAWYGMAFLPTTP